VTLALLLAPAGLLVLGALVIALADALSRAPGKTAGSLVGNVHVRRERPSPAERAGASWVLERSIGAAVFFAAALAVAVTCLVTGKAGAEGTRWMGSLNVDAAALAGFALIAAGGFFASLMAGGHLDELGADAGGFFPLLMLTAAGAMVFVAAWDFATFFIGLETMSLGAYALTGFRVVSPRSVEGSMKYFLLGSFASALLLYGLALLYGESGSMELDVVGRALDGAAARRPTVTLGAILVVSGLCFKVAAVPFHMWTPEAYQGAPTPATGFMATVVKAAAFIAAVRFVGNALPDEALAGPPCGWAAVFYALSIATMFWGNLAALRQKNVKRMLAYSSIAHAGYLLVGVTAGWVYPAAAGRAGWSFPPVVTGAILYYLAAYVAANAGAFAVVSLNCKGGNEATDIEDYRGYARRHPFAAVAMGVFMLSLLGIPPMGGFFGKLYLFRVAVEGNLWVPVLLGMIASAISAYYYLGVIVVMFMKEREGEAPGAEPISSNQIAAAIILALAAVLCLGLAPSPFYSVFSG